MEDRLLKPVISLCLPTNGIIEWVFPVLDSIYAQNVAQKKFEVIVTNNGDNQQFHSMMEKYESEHENLTYRKTTAFLFDNQLEALKFARGDFFKFVNHRTLLTEGSLDYLIKTIEENKEKKPVIYFSNGALNCDYQCKSFDEFVGCLGRYASWTTGVGIWEKDYLRIPDTQVYDKISPHSAILFSERHKENYLICDRQFCQEIESDHSKKGKYDLFKAFAVEEVSITQRLYIDGDITASTFKKVKKDYKKCVADFYWLFCIRKVPCSYDLSGFNDAMGIYFNKYSVILNAYMYGAKRVIQRLLGRNGK